MEQLVLSQRDLFLDLDREFQRLRPHDCYRCSVPLPIRRVANDASASNWTIEEPAPCPAHCNLVLISIVQRMQATHALGVSAPDVHVT